MTYPSLGFSPALTLPMPANAELHSNYFEYARRLIWLIGRPQAGHYDVPSTTLAELAAHTEDYYYAGDVKIVVDDEYYINDTSGYGDELAAIFPGSSWFLYCDPNKYHHWDLCSGRFWVATRGTGEGRTEVSWPLYAELPNQMPPKYQQVPKLINGTPTFRIFKDDGTPSAVEIARCWFTILASTQITNAQGSDYTFEGAEPAYYGSAEYADPRMNEAYQDGVITAIEFGGYRYPVDAAWKANLNFWSGATWSIATYDGYFSMGDEYFGCNGSAFEKALKEIGQYDWWWDDGVPHVNHWLKDSHPTLPTPVGCWRRCFRHTMVKPKNYAGDDALMWPGNAGNPPFYTSQNKICQYTGNIPGGYTNYYTDIGANYAAFLASYAAAAASHETEFTAMQARHNAIQTGTRSDNSHYDEHEVYPNIFNDMINALLECKWVQFYGNVGIYLKAWPSELFPPDTTSVASYQRYKGSSDGATPVRYAKSNRFGVGYAANVYGYSPTSYNFTDTLTDFKKEAFSAKVNGGDDDNMVWLASDQIQIHFKVGYAGSLTAEAGCTLAFNGVNLGASPNAPIEYAYFTAPVSVSGSDYWIDATFVTQWWPDSAFTFYYPDPACVYHTARFDIVPQGQIPVFALIDWDKVPSSVWAEDYSQAT